MAINLPDFTRAPLIDNVPDFFGEALKGYKASQEPKKMAQEQEQRELLNKGKKFDVEHQQEKFDIEKQYKEALMAKARQLAKGGANRVNPNGTVANEEYIWNQKHPQGTPLTPEEQIEHNKLLQDAFEAELEGKKERTNRTKVLNDTQENRAKRSPVAQIHYDIHQIDKGLMPGTKDKLTPQQQGSMKNDLLLDIVKKSTDPAMRQQLKAATDMNITLSTIDSGALTGYSGLKGKVVKLGDSLKSQFGKGSQQYDKYLLEQNKAMFAAKQMRAYLKSSIQPSEQMKLEKLSAPEAWNVTPEVAKKNFEFMRDLYKRETQTLVQQATDPSIYGKVAALKNSLTTQNPSNHEIRYPNPKIISTANGVSTIQSGNKTLKIPESEVDQFMLDNTSPELGEGYGD